MSQQDFFGVPLQPDPQIALPARTLSIPKKTGPLHRLQFVIEFVGPRSMPAAAAAAILSPQWSAALGEPQAWCMSATDTEWQPLIAGSMGSYDSLAISWDMITSRGEISAATASQLLATAEQFAGHIQRKAVPLPHPNDLGSTLAQLKGIRENLDIGFSLGVIPRSGFVAEKDVWIFCAQLGLTFSAEGSFDWMAAGAEGPLLSVTPLSADAFSLGAVQRGATHDGLSIGFSVPLCPAPVDALEGAFRVADVLSQALPGLVFDQDDQPLSEGIRQRYRRDLSEAVTALTNAGFAPGSAEAVRLFGG